MNQYAFIIKNLDTNTYTTRLVLAPSWQVARGILQLEKNEILVE